MEHLNPRLEHWNTYVAIGDSTSEGLWDVDEDGRMRGWTDRLAGKLARRKQRAGWGELRYANLAIRGKTLTPILEEQLPRAIELGADLISITAGGNDMMRPHVDVDAIAARLSEAVVAVRAQGIDVLLVTSSDPKDSPILELTRSRVTAFNCHLWSMARHHDCAVADQWGLAGLCSWSAWAEDRIHLRPEGHELVANAALVGLGFAPDDPHYAELPPTWSHDATQDRLPNQQWLRRHVLPWAGRHLRGHSSGDNRAAKRPDALPVTAEDTGA